MSARLDLPLDCTFCASTNLILAWTMYASRSTSQLQCQCVVTRVIISSRDDFQAGATAHPSHDWRCSRTARFFVWRPAGLHPNPGLAGRVSIRLLTIPGCGLHHSGLSARSCWRGASTSSCAPEMRARNLAADR